MEQQELFVEDIWDALKHGCIAVAIATKKHNAAKKWATIVGAMLWPSKSPDDAGKLLANCLDKNRAEKLDPDQILWIVRESKRAGCHVPMAYICDDAEYNRTIPIHHEDKQAELQRAFIAAVGRLDFIKREFEKVSK